MGTSTINNRYQVIKSLGQGAFATVWLAADRVQGDQTVAVKCIRPGMLNEQAISNFRREFDIMTRLKHPHLVQVYDFGQDRHSGSYYIAMEYMEGMNLKAWAQQEGFRKTRDVMDLLVICARALNYIHARGILHRDIKLQNILIGKQSLKIMDFGIADLMGKSKKGIIKGTLTYVAPETLGDQVDQRVDIYALGMVFYRLVTGQPFFSISNWNRIVYTLYKAKVFTEMKHTALAAIGNSRLQELVDRMTAYDPEERYASGAEIILAVNRLFNRFIPVETDITKKAYVLGAEFVGREVELASLMSFLEHDQAETLFLVRGQIGVGKSRLFYEFKRLCQLRDITYFSGDCLPRITRSYSPFLAIIQAMLWALPERALWKLGPPLKLILPHHPRLQDVASPQPYSQESRQDLIIQAVIETIACYARVQQGTLVLYINDVQWADLESWRLLDRLVVYLAQQRDLGVKCYACVREEDYADSRAHLQPLKNEGLLRQILLESFSEQAVHQYVRAVFGKDVDASVSAAVPDMHALVGGNPYYLQEVLRNLVASGGIARDHRLWTLREPITSRQVPTNLKDLVREQFQSLELSPDYRLWLQCLAVLKRPVSLQEFNGLWRKTASFPELPAIRVNGGTRDDTAITAFFTDMVRQEIITVYRDEGPVHYQVAHLVLAEVIEDTLPATQHTVLHLLLARALERLHVRRISDYLEELAYHYSRSPNQARAMHYFRLAGDAAANRFDNDKALTFYRMYLAQAEGQSTAECCDVHIRMGTIFRMRGDWQNTGEAYRQALDIARALQDKERIGRAHKVTGWLCYLQGEYDQAVTHYHKALQVFEHLGKQREYGETKGSLGIVYYKQAAYRRAIDCYTEAISLCERLDNKRNLAIFIGNMGSVYKELGDFERALSYFNKDLSLSKELGLKTGLAIASGDIAGVYQSMGRHQEARALYDQAIAHCRELSMKYYLCDYLYHQAEVYLAMDNLPAAKGLNDEASALALQVARREIQWQSRLLAVRIHALQTGGSSLAWLQPLQDMLSETENMEERAQVCYTLWQLGPLSNARDWRKQALKLYKKLHRKAAKWTYKQRIRKLKKGRS